MLIENQHVVDVGNATKVSQYADPLIDWSFRRVVQCRKRLQTAASSLALIHRMTPWNTLPRIWAAGTEQGSTSAQARAESAGQASALEGQRPKGHILFFICLLKRLPA